MPTDATRPNWQDVEKAFDEGAYCVDCPRLVKSPEPYEFWGMRGTDWVTHCSLLDEPGGHPSDCPAAVEMTYDA